MKIGEYVRNEFGIAKVIDIVNNNGIDILVFDKPICFLVNKETGEIKDNRLLNKLAIIDSVDISKIKSSPNIIDLIEVGDYVNGKKVDDKQYHYTDKDNYDMGEWCIFYENVALGDYQHDIKSIVTKEQFESMEYKVGE